MSRLGGTAAEALREGVALHQAGRLEEAAAHYRHALEAEPENPDALHLLGVLRHQAGEGEDGLALLQRAVALRPGFAEAHFNTGIMLMEMGRPGEAVAAFEGALAARKDQPEDHYNLSLALMAAGRPEPALIACRRALRIAPDYAEAEANRASILTALGRHEEALSAWRRAVRLGPKEAEFKLGLGNALRGLGRLGEAVTVYREVLEIDPDAAAAHNNLGVALSDQGRTDEALAAYARAIEIMPDFADAHCNLGVALKEQDRFDDALDAYRQAIAIDPRNAEAHNNTGVALRELGRLDGAVEAYRRAVGIDPDYAEAHWNLSLALLVTGRYREGWEEHEWRWRRQDFSPARRNFAQSQWDGGELGGAAILLHAEQGLGDTIQMLRYVGQVAAQGGRVILEVERSLAGLASQLGHAQVIAADDGALPDFDVHAPLLSLPRILNTDGGNIPAAGGYLAANRGSPWQPGAAPAVGMVWRGNPDHRNDRNRSMEAAHFAPLAEFAEIDPVSLQYGGAAELGAQGWGGRVEDLSPYLTDFAATAAIIDRLDLVVAVDTAVAHLAGAIGKEVWMVIPLVPDWRWLTEGETTPWYASMRIFRQTARGDWDGVMARVGAALRERYHSSPM